MKRHANPSSLRKVLKVARPCWPHLSGIILLGLLSTPVALLAPLPLKIAVDSVLGTASVAGLAACAALAATMVWRGQWRDW